MASVSKRKWTYKGAEREAWVVRYVDRGGKHRSRQFDRKKEADAYCREVEIELDAGTHVARRDSRTVSDLIDEFEADVARRAADGAVGQGYIDLCRTQLWYVRPVMGNVLVRDLKWQDVEALAIGLRTTRARSHGRVLSRQTCSNIIGVLGTMLNYGVRRGYAARNVVPDAVREIGPARIPKIETFSRDEARRLFDVLQSCGVGAQERNLLQMRAITYLGFVCGLRKGEILALTWDHIDFASGRIAVRQALATKGDSLKGPKTASGIRTLPLPQIVAEALEAYRPYVVPDPRGLLFRTKTGGALDNVNFYKMWHRLLVRAGMPGDANGRFRHFHATRHFAGSAWLEMGVSLAEVSRMMGHADTAITAKIYAHAIVETTHRTREMEAVAASLLPAPRTAIAQELRKAA